MVKKIVVIPSSQGCLGNGRQFEFGKNNYNS